MHRPGSPVSALFAGAATLLMCVATASSADAQIWRRVKEKVEQRVDQKVENAIDRSLDAVECMVTDPDCIAEAQAQGKNVVVTDTDGNPVSPSAGEPGEGLIVGVPGDGG